jgi:SSS family transporter
LNSSLLRIADYLALGGYLAAIIIVTKLSYRKQQTPEQYHLAGKTMSVSSVLLSTIVTFFSGITFLGVPAWTFKHDMSFYVRTFSLLPVAPVLIYLMIPFYHRLKVQTAYEYLERRFSRSVRQFASTLFLLMRGLYLAVVIYASSLALSVITGLSLQATIALIGVLCTTYTLVGGMKSVIWTQVTQFVVLVGGIVVVFVSLLTDTTGNFSQLWASASDAGKLRLFHFTLDPTLDVAFGGIIIGTFFQNLALYGADQVAVQHYMTARSLSNIRRTIWLQSLLVLPIVFFLHVIGLLLWLFYQQHPERLGALPSVDYVMAYFVVHELPAGVPGLIFAGLLAATMAVTAGGLSGLSAATMNDFYRLVKPGLNDRHYIRSSRIFTLCWGAMATMSALFVNRLGILIEASVKINTFFGGVLLGIFLLGMLSSRARGGATLAAGAVGLAIVCYVGLLTKISFFWYAPIGCGVTLLVGYLISRGGLPLDAQARKELVFAFKRPRGRDVIGLD